MERVYDLMPKYEYDYNEQSFMLVVLMLHYIQVYYIMKIST